MGRTFFVDTAPVIVEAVLPRGFNLFGSRPADEFELMPVVRPGPAANETGLDLVTPRVASTAGKFWSA